MLKIGLTGGIGSGKSTVAELFSELGVTVIDADQISHQLTRSGSDSFRAIRQLLGDEFINAEGELDRKKIARHIFSNPDKKAALENMLHPRIRQRMLQEVERAKHDAYIILSIPLLLETGFTDLIDRILVVDADDEIRIQRTRQRDDRSEQQIRAIMRQQVERDRRLQCADDVIYNNGSLEDLRNAVDRLHQQYLAMAD
ncbi:MAG: dephospho-CoA kinase [Gammaproteobacteria bacterium]|jgi:dephospho-CoA kinase|nr:dephospho-CoA kinase [Gammaproteobacteria bacterium]